MEIVFELLVQALLVVLQFLFEILLQIAGEALFGLGIRSVSAAFKRPPPSPGPAAVGHVILGAVAGLVSLWLFPDLFITSTWARWVNLFVTPLVAGAAMAGIGWLRRRKGQTTIRLDTFAYGFLFALAMAAVRLTWGK